MGDWIKENKFEAGLFLVVVLAAVGAYVVGGGQGKKYTEARDYYNVAVQQRSSLESKSPYPTDGNEREYGETVDAYRGVIEGLQEKLLAFRPPEFKQIAPSDFTDKLSTKREALALRYTEAGIEFPDEKWQLGFERYTATPPRDEATAYLSYQLDALDWLFGALADAKPTQLVNVVRTELPVESGASMDGEGNSRGRGRASAGSGTPFHVLPVEITFKAPEPTVRKFLGQIAGNDQHFFVIRSVRIQNEKRNKPPKKDDVDFDKKGKGGASPFDNSFDLIVPEGDAPAPEGDAPADSPPPAGEQPLFPTDPPEEAPPAGDGEEGGERILGQILGAEEVYVLLQLELILFKEKESSGLPMPKGKKTN